MTAWQQKVINEKRSLQEKYDKLVAHNAESTPECVNAHQALLYQQEIIMCQYLLILNERIKLFV